MLKQQQATYGMLSDDGDYQSLMTSIDEITMEELVEIFISHIG